MNTLHNGDLVIAQVDADRVVRAVVIGQVPEDQLNTRVRIMWRDRLDDATKVQAVLRDQCRIWRSASIHSVPFKVGDIVALVSGGPSMTVMAPPAYPEEDSDVPTVLCSWFFGTKFTSKQFPEVALVSAFEINSKSFDLDSGNLYSRIILEHKLGHHDEASNFEKQLWEKASTHFQALKDGRLALSEFVEAVLLVQP